MTTPAPQRRCPRAIVALLVLIALTAGIAGTTAPAPSPAGATTVTTGGSIVFIKGHNVWMIRPDGTGARQITTNGTAASPYRSPSRSDDGSVIVAVRDVHEQPGGFVRSYIHVMGPTGSPLRAPFAPEQYAAELGGACNPAVLVAPQGIDADVSPDGSRIVTLARADYFTFDCGGLPVGTASILRIDGTVQVAEVRSAGETQLSLRHPSWASNSRVLFHHSLDLSVHSYDVGAASTVEWAPPTDDFEDLAHEHPHMRAGRMVTTGFDGEADQTVRLWTATGPPTPPVKRCDVALEDPDIYVWDYEYSHGRLAADGSAVVWQETDLRGETPQPDIFISPLGDIAAGCGGIDRRLLVDGGTEPSWSPAPVPTGGPAATVPGAPTAVRATAGNAQATVTWTAPTNTGGSPITGYTVTPYIGTTAQPARTFTTTATTQTITGLTNGTAYTFRVAARNAVGLGPASTPSAAVTPTGGPTNPNLPGAPTITGVTAGDGEATLTWTPPAHTGASSLNGYLVTSYVDGQQYRLRIVNGPVLTTTFPGLVNGTTYTFRVAARNAHGAGEQSAPSAAVTPRSPHQRFVVAAYTDFLGRMPSASELTATATALDRRTTTRAAVVRDLARSPEWVSAVVIAMYVDTLGRPGEPSGVTYWSNEIRTGRRTVAQVASSFYASPEYFEGIGGGTLDSWIEDLYRKLLLRPGEAGGVAYWVGEVRRTNRTSVAFRFFQSPESARARVQGLYDALLGRAAEASGATYWAGRVVREGDIALATNLAASQEYYDRAQARF